MSNSDGGLITWLGGDGSPTIRIAPAVLVELVEQVMGGFRRYPWGGVEVGGALFGNRAEDGMEVQQIILADCEHARGPAFDLSDKDAEGFHRLLTSLRQRNGLIPVGWFHSLSNRELHLSDADRTLHERFFPEASSVAMVVKRSRKAPLAVVLFYRDRNGSLASHPREQEFAISDFQLAKVPVADWNPPAENSPAGAVPIVHALLRETSVRR